MDSIIVYTSDKALSSGIISISISLLLIIIFMWFFKPIVKIFRPTVTDVFSFKYYLFVSVCFCFCFGTALDIQDYYKKKYENEPLYTLGESGIFIPKVMNRHLSWKEISHLYWKDNIIQVHINLNVSELDFLNIEYNNKYVYTDYSLYNDIKEYYACYLILDMDDANISANRLFSYMDKQMKQNNPQYY